MKGIIFLMLGMTFVYDQTVHSTSQMSDVWKQEITYDWENLDHANAFKNWQKTFDKKYIDLKEKGHRFMIFLENWKKINEFNIAKNRNFTMRLNQFGDLNAEEFKYYVHGHAGSCFKKQAFQKNVTKHQKKITNTNAPESIDWTNYNGKNYVTPVKNQGQCGSCWAFSATGSIESRTAIAKQQTGSAIISLSEQQLVDCSSKNSGCNGGLMDYAYQYIIATGGLCSEKAYPYKARQGTCQSASCGSIYDAITGYQDVARESEPSLVDALADGPVSIAIEADQSAFQFYSSGILDGLCGTKLDHGVLAVGYGTESGEDYWKVKNSWGPSWGENGYVLICRNCGKNGRNGECGVLKEPSYPKLN